MADGLLDLPAPPGEKKLFGVLGKKKGGDILPPSEVPQRKGFFGLFGGSPAKDVVVAPPSKRVVKLNNEYTELLKKKDALEAEVDRLSSEKSLGLSKKKVKLQSTRDALVQEIAALKSAKRDMLSHEQSVQGEMARLGATELDLKTREEELGKREVEVKRIDADIANQKRVLEERMAQFIAHEKELIDREVKWLRREGEVRESVDNLKRQFADLGTEANVHKREFSSLHEEWVKKKGELAALQGAVEKVKSAAQSIVQVDLKALKEKETEVARIVDQINTRHRAVEEEKKLLNDKRKELERTLKEFKHEQQKLKAAQSVHAKREAYLKNSIAKLEKVKKKVTSEEKRVERARELHENLHHLEELEQEMEDRLSGSAGKLLVKEKRATKNLEEMKFIGTSDPKQLIAEVNSELSARDFRAAKQALERLRLLQHRLPTSEEKRLLQYDIAELSAALKLAVLG